MTDVLKQGDAGGGSAWAVQSRTEAGAGEMVIADTPIWTTATPLGRLVSLGDKIADACALFASAVELSRALETEPPRRQRDLAQAWWIDSTRL